ncbi:hypothetical protein LCGC14_0282330 [marine sediment metagenome]|uniref:ParB/Spo0J HTH domain-containing protein n=1 Tax=marine sediment metagenome TaxID=412755 RepID=A0A0F9U0H1_9ZZZZ
MENHFDNFGLEKASKAKFNLVGGQIKTAMRAAGKTADFFKIDPRKIHLLEDFNPRIKDRQYYEGTEDRPGIVDLAKSMKLNGYYTDKPLAGFVAKVDGEDVIYLTEGHRRLDAVLYWMDNLGGPEDFMVPFVPKPRGTTELDLNYALVEANKAVDFRPYELAMHIKRLHCMFGQTEALIATKAGMSVSHVKNLLAVAGAPESIAKMVLAEEISVTEAAEAIGKYGNQVETVLNQAKANSVAAGKTKVSKRFLPGERFKKEVKKESDTLFDAVRTVREDNNYDALTEDTRKTLDELMERMTAMQKKLDEQEAQALAAAALEEADEAAQESNGKDDVKDQEI